MNERTLDARKCIAYWTIEARALAPRELRPKFGRWFFGCDVCQESCPHNVRPPETREDDFLPKNAFIDLPELLEQEDDMILERFTGTPLRRPGAAGLKRNALIVLANVGTDAVVPSVRHCLTHPEAVVRAAAIWCLGRLGEPVPVPHRDEVSMVTDEYRAVCDGSVPVRTR